MKKTILLVILAVFPLIGQAQDKKEDNWFYTNTNFLNLYLSPKQDINDSPDIPNSWGMELMSYHGYVAWQHLELALGIGLNVNFAVKAEAIPLNLRLVYFTQKYNKDGLYFGAELGPYLNIAAFETGGSFKLIAGYKFYINPYSNTQILLEIHNQNRDYVFENKSITLSGAGLGVGILF